MSWNYPTKARKAVCSLLRSPHPPDLTRLSLQCPAFFAFAEGPINYLKSNYEHIHAPKSRRTDIHNWPHSKSARFLGARPLVASGFASGVSSRKEFLPYQLSKARFASTLAAERHQGPDNNISNSEQPTLPFDVSTTLTPAQASRSARRAVVLALQNQIGGCHDALHIVNSLLYPIFEQDPTIADFLNMSPSPATTLDRRISPRLVSHALVHGLIRQDRLKHAATLAVAMMQVGMRVRTRTLTAVMGSLKPPQNLENNALKGIFPVNFRPDPRSLDDLVEMAEHDGTRLALEIFTVARRTGQENMRGLFSTLLAICIINTEIIIACFAFAIIVKEFYYPPPSPQYDTCKSNWNTAKYGPRSLVFLPQWSHIIDLTTPLKSFFRHVTTLHTASPQFDRDALNANLQALAILANLLDLRQLHLPMISALLTLMYNTPRITSEVWVLDEAGNVRREVAFQYFNDVLTRLIESPPPHEIPGKRRRTSRASTPPLSLETCNTLLHYALRHRHSRTLANKTLVHMVKERKLEPNEVTYNVLLRAGTLLRDDDLASLALSTITKSRDDPKQHEPPPEPRSGVASPLGALTYSKSEMARRIASAIKKIQSLHLSQNPAKDLKDALYLLSTLMMHLCATGHPHYAKTIIFALFPVLDRDSSASFEQHMVRRRKAIKQAAQYGPVTFSVLLNALVKARAFSEARLLYNFAVAAERRSWFTGNPWTLGVDVYTIMLGLCAGECREATRLEGIPAAVADRKPIEVRVKAVRMALRLYKRMNQMPYTAYNTMRCYGYLRNVSKLVLPKPDEGYAGALIKVLFLLSKHLDPSTVAVPDIFTKHRNPARVQMKVSPAAVAKTYAETKQRLTKRNELPEGWTQQLQFVARGIIDAGMEIPPALRHLFLGRNKKAASPSDNERRVSLRVVPWAYPAEAKKDSWHPWTIQSIRTRGLLMKKMTRGQRARFYRRRREV